MVGKSCNPIEERAHRGRGTGVQSHPSPQSKFKASLGFRRPCLNKTKQYIDTPTEENLEIQKAHTHKEIKIIHNLKTQG